MCDVAHVILLEKLDAVEVGIMDAAMAGGAEGYPGPDFEQVRVSLDEMLQAPFAPVQAMSTEDVELRKAVGLL